MLPTGRTCRLLGVYTRCGHHRLHSGRDRLPSCTHCRGEEHGLAMDRLARASQLERNLEILRFVGVLRLQPTYPGFSDAAIPKLG